MPKLKAEWINDYDFREDKCYTIPGCPECYAPIGKISDEDDEYHCFSCGRIVEIDEKMEKWFEPRSEKKTEMHDCFPAELKMKDGTVTKMGCGGKKCMEVHYMRNPVTLNWQEMGGECKNCGFKYII